MQRRERIPNLAVASWDVPGQARTAEAEKKGLRRQSFTGAGRWGEADLLFLDYLGSPPKSSLALPCLTLALPETLIFPAPSVWICLLPNLSNA